MNYTDSDAFVTHTGTGNRMHQSDQPVPTEVSADDMNSVFWSLMEVIKSAGFAGLSFDADNAATYGLLLRALRKAFVPTSDMVNIAPYLTDITGATDQSTQAQAALSTGKSVFVPDGVTVRASGLQMVADGQRLYGLGRGSRLLAASNAEPCLIMSGVRQELFGLILDSGALSNDASPDFCGVRVTGSRSTVRMVSTLGTWARGVDFVDALYSAVVFCNIDGFRRRGVSIKGGTYNRVLLSKVFEASLVAPVDANVYLDNAPSSYVQKNHITRGKGAGLRAVATPPPGGANHTLLYASYNDIDNLEGRAIDIDGYWNVHVDHNWCSAGQGATATGQIRVQNSKLLYLQSNDVKGSLGAGVGILVKDCAEGTISDNTVEYNQTNLVLDGTTGILVSGNRVGQLTGLPPTGTPSAVNFQGLNLVDSAGNWFVDNRSVNPTSAHYVGIDRHTILEARTLSTRANGDAYMRDRSLYVGNDDLAGTSPRGIHLRTRHTGAFGSVTFGYDDTNNGGITGDGMGLGTDQCALRFYTRDGTGRHEAWQMNNTGHFIPGADNAYSIGLPTFRTSVVYSVTGSISTSDQREKADVAPLGVGLDFINSLQPVSYRWVVGENVVREVEDGFEEVEIEPAGEPVLSADGEVVAPGRPAVVGQRQKFRRVIESRPGVRTHWGLIAQQVKDALPAGLDFGGWVLEAPGDAESRQGLRYEQFIAPLIKAVQELGSEVQALKNAGSE